MFEDELNKMTQQGASRDAISEQRDKVAEYSEAEAARQLKLSFVTDEIAQREDLSVSDEELDTSMEEMAKESQGEESKIKEYFKSDRVRERYRDQLRVKKILDFIVNNAKIEEIDELEPEPESDQLPPDEKGDS